MTRVSNEVESLADTSVELGGAALLADVREGLGVAIPAEGSSGTTRWSSAITTPRRRVGGC
jgi:hypothetical protein